MESINELIKGFLLVGSPERLLICFVGVTVGTITGVLPGLGPVGAMALLFPLSIRLDPLSGIIMLAGIYYGAMYGGSTTSVLMKVPGEAASVITCIDGYEMAKKGRAGAALAAAAIGSWVAGTIGIVVVMFFAPWLGRIAVKLGPPEYFAIALCGLVVLSNITGTSFIKAFLGVILGLMLSTIGIDKLTGASRFTFGSLELSNGLELVSIMMGLFGFGEVLSTVLNPYEVKDVVKVKFKDLYPRIEEIKGSILPILRGTFVGLPIGLLPGPVAFISTIISYKLEKSCSKEPSKFGHGAIEGVAGPESANNAAATTGMIPLLSLGLPLNGTMAILLGAFMVHGIIPGPLFIKEYGDLFWGIIASMYIGNVMLLVLNLPLVGVFASLIKVSPKILMPLITGIIIVGVYSVNNSMFDVWLALLFGIIGFVMKLIDFDVVPLILGFVLGSVLERSLRQGLIMVDGHFLKFMQRPFTSIFIGLTILILLIQASRFYLNRRKLTKGGVEV